MKSKNTLVAEASDALKGLMTKADIGNDALAAKLSGKADDGTVKTGVSSSRVSELRNGKNATGHLRNVIEIAQTCGINRASDWIAKTVAGRLHGSFVDLEDFPEIFDAVRRVIVSKAKAKATGKVAPKTIRKAKTTRKTKTKTTAEKAKAAKSKATRKAKTPVTAAEVIAKT